MYNINHTEGHCIKSPVTIALNEDFVGQYNTKQSKLTLHLYKPTKLNYHPGYISNVLVLLLLSPEH